MFAGNSGVLTLAHVSFAGIAAYVSAILSTPALIKGTLIGSAPLGLAKVELPVPVAMLVGIIVTTALAALIGLALARLDGISATIVTLALVIVVFAVLTNWKQRDRRRRGVLRHPVHDYHLVGTGRGARSSPCRATFQGLEAGVARTGHSRGRRRRSRHRRQGRALALLVMGIELCAVRAGGVLMAHFLGAISPAGFYFTLLFLTLSMLVLGGEYSVTGGWSWARSS